MANFQNNAITESGVILKSHVDMGAVFTPTRIVIGSGYIPAGKTAKTMTDVVETVKVLQLNKKERTPDGKAIFGGMYSNEDITAAFFFRELALYAKAVYADGTEIPECLYSYGNAGETAELMPAYSTGTVVERQMDLVTYIGNDAQVNLTIESGVVVTAESLKKEISTSASTEFSNGSIILTIPGAVLKDGTLIKFCAPCTSQEATGALEINGESYDIITPMLKGVAGKRGFWEAGAHLTVVIDQTNHRAFLQGAGGGHSFVVSEKKPTDTPTLWFRVITSEISEPESTDDTEAVVLDLAESGDSEVKALIDGQMYDITNAGVNITPTEDTYSFTII